MNGSKFFFKLLALAWSMLKPGQFSLADSELNEAVSWYWQGDTTLGLGRSSESVCTNSAMGLQVI